MPCLAFLLLIFTVILSLTMKTTEFHAIETLFRQRLPFRHLTTTLSNGDDASVHHIAQGYELVVSTDTAVAGVHWPHDMPLDIAAQRAICAALSDLAAMGAQASWIWLSVVAQNMDDLQAMSDGVVEVCQHYQLELAGGDTVCAPINMLNVTVGGLVPHKQAMTRKQARIGDDIWLIGDLGLSAQGLQQWLAGNKEGNCIPYFQSITPQLSAGVRLQKIGVKCCIDVSDGLMQDAAHIASASQVCFMIEQEQLQKLTHYHSTSMQNILAGGEDYALLCTAPPRLRQQLTQLQATPIGSCQAGSDVQLTYQGNIIPYHSKGYHHFA